MLSSIKTLLANAAYQFWGGKHYVHSLLRLFRLIFQNWGYLALGVVCMVGYNLFTAAPAWYIKNVVDSLEKGRIPEIERFVFVGLIIVLIFSMKGFFYFGQSYLMGLVGQRLVFKLRTSLYAHLQKLSFSFFTKHPAGDLIARFTSDLLNLQNALKVSISGPLRDIPQIFILLAILVIRSWELFILSLVLIPIALLLISKFGKRNNALTTERLVTFGRMTSLLMETMTGIRVVKAFGMERYEQNRFEEANRELLRKQMRTTAINSYSAPVLEIIGAICGASIVTFGGYLIIHGQITGGSFVSFLFAFFLLNDPIRKLNGFHMTMQEGIASADRVFQLLDIEPEIVDRPDAAVLGPMEEGIHIHVEEFRYGPQEEPVLENVEMDIQVGQVVALVGASGSGKTTLVNLIPRFIDLQRGSILIDGMDIREVKISSLRKQIAIVTQEIFLFNDTVANNIAYGHIECPHEEIEKAAIAANAHGFIQDLPQGYETLVGEGGTRLSGGQRQRLAIARAIIKNAPILILDEATSSLDSESELEVQQALENLFANRTTIVIAHRLSTIRKADFIYVLEKGRIVESGRHAELLKKGGAYEKLHSIQFRDVLPSPARPSPWRRPWRRDASLEEEISKPN